MLYARFMRIVLVLVLSSCCLRIVLILHTYGIRSVCVCFFVLYSYCVRRVLVLHAHCMCIVSVLCSYDVGRVFALP